MMFRGPQMVRAGGHAARAGSRAHSAWRVLAGLAAAPVVVVSVFRAVPREWPTTVVQLVSFTPWLVLPAGVSLVFAVLGRRRWMAGAAAGLVAVQLFWLVPLDYGRAEADAADGTGEDALELRTMSLNAKLGKADAAEIVRLVREHGVTVLTLQEYTRPLELRLEAAGLTELLPNRINDPAAHAAGTAVYSVHRLVREGKVPDSHFPMPIIRLTAEDGGRTADVGLTSVHARAPVGVGLPKWRSDLAALGRLASRPGHVVLAGDFNASYDHAEFRRVLQDGDRKMVDVGMAQGSRLVPTWPMEDLPLPGITIDHIVTSPGVRSADYSVHRVAGTDHAAIVVTLSVPASG